MERHRLEIRPSLEILAAIDAARGDVLRTTWVMGAIMQRLNNSTREAALTDGRSGDDGLRLVRRPPPGQSGSPPASSRLEPAASAPARPSSDAPRQTTAPVSDEQLDPGPEAEPEPEPEPEPEFPRRPPPRMGGGGRRR